MYKLIAIDLDGTLLNDEKTIPKYNIEILNELLNRSYEIVFATGRKYMSAKKFTKELNGDILIFANNGNIIRNSKDDKLERAYHLSSDNIYNLILLGKSLGLQPVIHVDNFKDGIDIIIEGDKDDKRYYGYLDKEKRYRAFDKFTEENLKKILSLVYVGNLNDLSLFKDRIDKEYKDEFKTYLMTNIQMAEALLEVCNPNISKWKSIKDYALGSGFKLDEVLVVGDDINDKEMVENAGLGIAMKNAVEEVKIVSDIVTKYDNNQAGLGRILKKIFKL